jgi:hypothetical protein
MSLNSLYLSRKIKGEKGSQLKIIQECHHHKMELFVVVVDDFKYGPFLVNCWIQHSMYASVFYCLPM